MRSRGNPEKGYYSTASLWKEYYNTQKNFSWIVEGTIAGSSCPGNGQASELDPDLDWLASKGIKAIVSLNESGLDRLKLFSRGFAHLYLPVDDHYAPSMEQMEKMVAFVDLHREQGSATLVHCNAGQGRTGTMLAAYLIAKGDLAADAIKRLRKERRGSCSTNQQIKGLEDWAEHLLDL